jgi:hypothetical protein
MVVRIQGLEAMFGRKYIAEYTPAKSTMTPVNVSEFPNTGSSYAFSRLGNSSPKKSKFG